MEKWILKNVHEQSIIPRPQLVVRYDLGELLLSYQTIMGELFYFCLVLLQSNVVKNLEQFNLRRQRLFKVASVTSTAERVPH